MALAHPRGVAAQPCSVGGRICTRYQHSATMVMRHRVNAVADVDTATFDDEVLQAEVPVVVDFWAHWCGPCKLIDPVMKELEANSDGQLKVVKVEVDSNPELVEKYEVYGLPTLILFKDGADVQGSKREGAIAKKGVLAWMESNGVTIGL
eukprot:jgi/Ulvmu1/5927/UM026_0049.1